MNPFRYSFKDAIQIALSPLCLAVEVAGCLLWETGHHLIFGLMPAITPIMGCANYQCISDNNKYANRLVTELNSRSLGIPQTPLAASNREVHDHTSPLALFLLFRLIECPLLIVTPTLVERVISLIIGAFTEDHLTTEAAG